MSEERELRKGSAELLILSLLDERERHGYDLAKLIERRSEGELTFHVASLYPILYRLERRGLIVGRWVEKPGQRRRRFYTLTAEGERTLAAQRRSWKAFFTSATYLSSLWTTLRIWLIVLALTLAIGYPVAYFLARSPSRWRSWLTTLVVFPLLLNLVVRTFGWIALLAPNRVASSYARLV